MMIVATNAVTAAEELRCCYRDRLAEAAAARADGRKVVAYAGHTVPVELIQAAGAFALQITGDPERATPLADTFLDDDIDGDIRSLFQRIVDGEFNLADLIVLPRSSNGLLYLYYFLLEARRWLPERQFPEVLLFDVLHTPYASTGEYVLGRVCALSERLARLCGGEPGAGALHEAIAIVNDNRRVLQALNELRRLPRPLLGGAAYLRLAGAGRFMEPARHTALLRELLDEAPAWSALKGVRLMVKGAAQDNAEFYELVERLGAVIVADDHANGERDAERLVYEDAEPLASLAEHYQLHVPTVRSFPQAKQDRRFMEIVAEAGVQGVIFYHDEFDDTLGWDYPQQKRLLDARGIPSLLLQQQSYRFPDRAAQAAAVRDLIARSLEQ
ncbi:MAG: 2-hydroxyacyl-CoA dehydratase family protein [Pseudomonadota bacterium]